MYLVFTHLGNSWIWPWHFKIIYSAMKIQFDYIYIKIYLHTFLNSSLICISATELRRSYRQTSLFHDCQERQHISSCERFLLLKSTILPLNMNLRTCICWTCLSWFIGLKWIIDSKLERRGENRVFLRGPYSSWSPFSLLLIHLERIHIHWMLSFLHYSKQVKSYSFYLRVI